MTQRPNAIRFALCAISLVASSAFTGCHDNTQEASVQNFTAAMNSFLAQRGHVCLAKYDWPIYVTADDRAKKSPGSVQMGVLEKLGLVTGSNVVIERKNEDGDEIAAKAREYRLTSAGQQYYLHIPVVIATATLRVTHPADFCVATLTLDKVIGWEPPRRSNGRVVTSVLYTYRIHPVSWARAPDVQRAFPMIPRLIEGEGTMELREGVHLTPQGWVADELS